MNDAITRPGNDSWRAVRAETAARLATAGVASPDVEARLVVEEAAGAEGVALLPALDHPVTERHLERLEALVSRRLAGEPLQYVLGRWAFRTLDLCVDPRVLIPRPETEVVAGHALAELDRRIARLGREHPLAVDLGTGSGALALAIAVERPGARVWAVERSAAALAVARANLSGIGSTAANVCLLEGSWFVPLPEELRGRVDVIVTNPPYVADGDPLPPEVGDHEPREALIAGPTGLEAITEIVAGARSWLAPGAALVVEIGATQSAAARELAAAAGFVDVAVHPDLAGRSRVLVGREPEPGR